MNTEETVKFLQEVTVIYNADKLMMQKIANRFKAAMAVVEAAKHAWEFREDHDHNGYQIRGRDLDPLGQAIDALEQEP